MLKKSPLSNTKEVFIDDEPWIVFLDESGDQGKPALEALIDKDRKASDIWPQFAGGSRYFTIAGIAVKASRATEVEQMIGEGLRRAEGGRERKWCVSSEASRQRFISRATEVLQAFPDSCAMGGITIDKSRLSDFSIKQRKISVYNKMACDLIMTLTRVIKPNGIEIMPQNIRLVCDQRPVSSKAFENLGFMVANELAPVTNFQESVSCEPVNSKECFMIQMSDHLSGMLRQNIERNLRFSGFSELKTLIRQKMFHPPEIEVHKKYTDWTGMPEHG